MACLISNLNNTIPSIKLTTNNTTTAASWNANVLTGAAEVYPIVASKDNYRYYINQVVESTADNQTLYLMLKYPTNPNALSILYVIGESGTQQTGGTFMKLN